MLWPAGGCQPSPSLTGKAQTSHKVHDQHTTTWTMLLLTSHLVHLVSLHRAVEIISQGLTWVHAYMPCFVMCRITANNVKRNSSTSVGRTILYSDSTWRSISITSYMMFLSTLKERWNLALDGGKRTLRQRSTFKFMGPPLTSSLPTYGISIASPKLHRGTKYTQDGAVYPCIHA